MKTWLYLRKREENGKNESCRTGETKDENGEEKPEESKRFCKNCRRQGRIKGTKDEGRHDRKNKVREEDRGKGRERGRSRRKIIKIGRAEHGRTDRDSRENEKQRMHTKREKSS